MSVVPAQYPAPPSLEEATSILDAISARWPLVLMFGVLFTVSVLAVFAVLRLWRHHQIWMDERDQKIREDERNAKR